MRGAVPGRRRAHERRVFKLAQQIALRAYEGEIVEFAVVIRRADGGYEYVTSTDGPVADCMAAARRKIQEFESEARTAAVTVSSETSVK